MPLPAMPAACPEGGGNRTSERVAAALASFSDVDQAERAQHGSTRSGLLLIAENSTKLQWKYCAVYCKRPR